VRQLPALPLLERGRLSPSSSAAPSIGDRLATIRERIAAAATRSGRDPDDLTLVAVGKRQPVAALKAAWDAGQRVFGENLVQEAVAKKPQLPASVEWHLIGPLQSNKAARAVDLFDVIHSVDRLKIARALDRHAGIRGRRLAVFLEINLAGEASKHGFAPGEVDGLGQVLARLENLEIVGLMAVPPREDDPGEARRWFERLRQLRDGAGRSGLFHGAQGLLSMGMSDDFEIAIEEGATHVRIGTALFGSRPPMESSW